MSGSSSNSEADGRHLILVVDDEPAVRAMVLTSIRVKADLYRVIEAGNGSDAVSLAREKHPSLVLLDVALPDHDGFWVCRQLKAEPTNAGMLVIMLTAMGLASDREHAAAAGADGYIVKPFSPRALLEELARRLPS